MPNIKLILEYDGTNYHGWQRQSNLPSIQGIIEERLKIIAKEEIDLTGAGRTDAGVHALGQVANFRTESAMTPDSWKKALNSLLPEDIVVLGAEYALEDFHARFSAKEKVYQYCILNSDTPSVFERRYAWEIYKKLNLQRIRETSLFLLGEHDFSSFRPLVYKEEDGICNISEIRIRKKGKLILIDIKGNRFFHHMVRNIVGTLVDIGRRKISPLAMEEILNSKDRRMAGRTAPAKGLFLLEVKY